MRWIGHCTEEEVKTASLQMLAWQRKEGKRRNCKFHVHDTKEMQGAWVGLLDWINNEFFPLNFEVGLRYNISILSPDLFSKISSQELYRSNNIKLPTVLFDTLSEAEKWLTKKYLEL